MTKAEQREIWVLKSQHPDMRDVPDSVIYVIMKRAKQAAISGMLSKK